MATRAVSGGAKPGGRGVVVKGKERVDVLLVERGLVETRSRAQARVLAGDVVVNDHRIDKPGTLVSVDAAIRLKGDGLQWVSRGGLKLERALSLWPLPVQGAVCLDVGASTGGFTDVLLHHGARLVHAIDVGTAQLHEKLRQDPRVLSREKTHIKTLSPGDLDPPPTVGVVDVSFISLTRVLPFMVPLLARPCFLVALIKPQFEAGRDYVDKGGIVSDAAVQREVLERVLREAAGLGLVLLGTAESPIRGSDGNLEWLAAFQGPPE